MPRPISLFAAVVGAPLLGLAVHAAVPAHTPGASSGQAAAVLPNNLCASCHGSRRVVSLGADGLDARDLLAAQAYLPDARG